MMGELNSTKDLEYLLDFKLKYPDVMKDFVRRQLISGSKEAILSLEYMTLLMPTEDMKSVVGSLNDLDRHTWMATVGQEKQIPDPAKLMGYIKGEMLKSFMATRPLVDPELLELTLKLKLHDVLKFTELHPASSGELLNLLNPAFISKVLDKVDITKMEKILIAAVDSDLSPAAAGTLKNHLKSYLTLNQKNSLAPKLLKVLEGVEPDKEKIIYASMLRSASSDDLIETAVKNCPLEVVWLLPKSALNDILSVYPLQKKARLLVGLEESERQVLLEASSSEGSSARQMIDMEMKQIEENTLEFKRCQSQRTHQLHDFLKFLRQHSQTNEQILSDIRMSCLIWFSQLAEKTHPVAQAA